MNLHDVIALIKKEDKKNGIPPTRQDLLNLGVSDWFLRKYSIHELYKKAGVEKNKLQAKLKKIKILVLDIEATYLQLNGYGLFNQNFSIDDIEKDWSILSYAAQFLDENKIHYNDTRKKKDKRDDKQLAKELFKLIEKSDVVITWNGDKFDFKKISSRLVYHGLFPRKKVISEDLYKLVKREFGEVSNKLDFWAKKLGCGSKLKNRKFHGKELTRQCLLNNPEAWKELELYNKMDIEITKKLYEKLAPWSNKINANLFSNSYAYVCKCGSTDFKHNGFSYNKSGKYKLLRCRSCGAIYRNPKNEIASSKREFMLRT